MNRTVSKKRVYRILQNEASLSRADDQALFYAMQILIAPPSAPSGRCYAAVKTVLQAMELHGQFSTNFLAAQVLTSMYEVGHGFFPAAYLSVSNCARIFCALGLHDRRKATQALNSGDTWTETEERRRIWWAVLMLDRYIHIGFRFRPLATPAIPADEILPSKDEAWDHGELAVNPLLVMSIDTCVSVSPFARTCQAAHLLGRVCEHVNNHPTASSAEDHFKEAYQLFRATTALSTMLFHEASEAHEDAYLFFTARGLCYAALGTLYDVHSCIEVDSVETVGGNRGLRIDLQQLAIDGLKENSAQIRDLATEVVQFIQLHGFDRVSPLILQCFYNAAGTYAWYVRETGSPEHTASLATLRGAIETLKERWLVSCKYMHPIVWRESKTNAKTKLRF